MRFLLLLFAPVLFWNALQAQNQLYYTVKFPDDVTVYGCNAAAPFTQPDIVKYGNCSFNVGVSYHDQVFNLGDGPGCTKIFRQWTLLWWCDYNPNWPAPLIIENPANSDIGASAVGNSDNHGYLRYTQIIKVLDNQDPVFAACPSAPLDIKDYSTNHPQLWNSMQWWDSQSASHDLCEGPVDLTVSATDSCSGNNISLRYLLFLDLDNTGTMETVISSTNLPPANTVFFNNANTPNYGGGNARAFDHRNVPANQKYAFALETVTNGANVTGRVRWNTQQSPGVYTVPELPYGTHKIKWIAEDGCGNEKSCEYLFTIRDGAPPTVVCIDGLSTNLMPPGMVSIADYLFIQDKYDNCTPASQVKIGIRVAGTGTGFPVDQHEVSFDCFSLGQQPVEIWVEDNAGNADYCLTYVLVQDNIGVCAPGDPFKGTVQTAETQAPIHGAAVQLKQNGLLVAESSTDSLGEFAFGSMPAGCGYELSVSAQGQAGTGLNAYDILLGALHQAGHPVLTSPYTIIAADTDGDQQVNNNDLQAMIQVLLGGTDTFPVANWKFVPASHVFPNPAQPFAGGLPSTASLCLTGPFAPGAADFTAVKTGDLNASWQGTGNRSVDGPVYFHTLNQRFEAGEMLEVTVYAPDMQAVRAFQLALGWDPTVLAYLGMEGLLVPESQTMTYDQEIRACGYTTEEGLGKNWRPGVFTLRFQAQQTGTLKKCLFVKNENLAAEAYNVDGQTFAVVLDFVEPDPTAFSFRPVQPNPASNRIQAPFTLSEACDVAFDLTDALGRSVFTQTAWFEAGEHVQTFDVSNLDGIVTVRISAAGQSKAQRVVVKR